MSVGEMLTPSFTIHRSRNAFSDDMDDDSSETSLSARSSVGIVELASEYEARGSPVTIILSLLL